MQRRLVLAKLLRHHFKTDHLPMEAVLFYLIIKPLSWLPLPWLHRLSNILAWVLYRPAKFRSKVIRQNISRSFPEKPKAEQEKIVRGYYLHLTDLIVEAIKSFSISRAEIMDRCRAINPEIFAPYHKKGQSVIVAAGHYNNWEMVATAFAAQIEHNCIGLYKPLKSAFFNQKITASRSRFGMRMVSIRDTRDYFSTDKGINLTLFATDQSPSNPKRAHWVKFLNQDTGVLFGTEAYARKYQLPVFYGHIEKVGRGRYEISFELITDAPQEMPEGALTEAHTKLLEKDIRQAPEYWLWSHRRWKHKRPSQEEIAAAKD